MVYYWLSWIGIVCIIFFVTDDQYLKKIILWILLLNLIFINVHIQLGMFTFTLPYIYTLFIFWGLIIVKTMPYHNYYLLFCLIFLYLGLRYILIVSPIWLFTNQFFLIAVLFICILILLVRNNQQRIDILMSATLTGEWLYAYNAKRLDWNIIIGETDFFLSLYLAIFLLYLFHRSTTSTKSSQI